MAPACPAAHLFCTQHNPSADRARVRLLPSYETVTIRCKELGEKEERTREERERDRGGSRGGDRSGRSSRGEEERHRHKRGALRVEAVEAGASAG